MNDFKKEVINIVKKIPPKHVLSYGDVASLAGKPRCARQVGMILRGLTIEEEEVPWWRVVNKQGRISIEQGLGGVEKELQKSLLEKEGILINEQYKLDIRKYRWLN